MCNVMSVNHVACSIDEVSDMSGQLSDPDAVAGGTCCKAAGVITVDVGVLVVAESVHLVGNCLSDACC